ncbi:META domain-containing protein [Streptomyces chromofuscus]|uniref:META domain-containing protein n=1 Tax=Streptomyces chromofuscus TaxID=42881 RepID=A0A7M2T2I3_STRCW|nr:META domain-containing protein [Streptomyces chromofuscus]QOV41731.1 META domain-containing protein [Streptomyces chromofuscus]GGS88907.1 lipoprotein [Streptomyces chromofuscus]
MYRQKQRITRTAALALLPLAAACGTEQAGSTTADAGKPVTGVHWTVDSVTVDGTEHDAPADAYVTIDDSGRAQGNYGCNHFSAQATFDGDRVRLGDATVTEMACEEGPMTFEENLARTLADGPLRTEVSGDRLTLTTEAGDTVRLTEERAAPLYGTRWTVTTLGEGGPDGVAEPLPAGAEGTAHLTFDKAAGSVGGRLTCNKVNADATVRDGRITLGPASTTRMMCEASLMATEKRLLRLFDSTVSYRLEHRTLTLTSENGETVTATAER